VWTIGLAWRKNSAQSSISSAVICSGGTLMYPAAGRRSVQLSKLGQHAVVLGAGLGGLLAARVLSEFYGTVTLVERDVLADGSAQRRGVPPGRHVHAFLSNGSQGVGSVVPRIARRARGRGRQCVR
jgi:hypothetical protein